MLNEQKKIEVAYFVAKNELPFTKYAPILNLEQMHGVELGKSLYD